MNKILIIAPHSDDEVLGCGGIIDRFSKEGVEIVVVIVTNASVGAPELFLPEHVEQTRNDALKAHKILGVSKTIFLDFPAPRLDNFPNYKIANAFSKIIQEEKPDTLFIPHRGDIHKDHEAVFDAALVAARPINNCSVKTIYAYETLSETEWAIPNGEKYFIPNVFLSIENFIASKIEAMKQFKRQIKQYPHPRSVEGINALAMYRGITVGVKYAEAFMLIRDIN